jgi:hypothetical protein
MLTLPSRKQINATQHDLPCESCAENANTGLVMWIRSETSPSRCDVRRPHNSICVLLCRRNGGCQVEVWMGKKLVWWCLSLLHSPRKTSGCERHSATAPQHGYVNWRWGNVPCILNLCIRFRYSGFILSRVGVVAWLIRRSLDWTIGFIDILYTITGSIGNYSAIAILHTFQFTVAHALLFSVLTRRIPATDLSQTHCHFRSHMKSSFHSAVPFLPLFCNCQLSSFPCSYPGRLASPTRLFTTHYYSVQRYAPERFFIIILHGPLGKHRLLLSRRLVYWPVA